MMLYLRSVYYSFPVQLVILYLKKFQVLLIFWFILFSTFHGGFMHSFGADALFMAPEYLNNVNALSAGIVGAALGAFIMSWNVTTFILFSRHFRFLATTGRPFLKYCTNNFILPGCLLIDYFIQAVEFDRTKELMTNGEIAWLIAGFLTGFFLVIGLSMLYFFEADRSIIRQMTPLITNPKLFKSQFNSKDTQLNPSRLIKVKWYLNTPFAVKPVRDVSHYSKEFIERIFSRHHFAAIISIIFAFLILVVVGFFMDKPFFQLPAAASIFLFFSILISLSGAFSYFMQSWSLPILIVLFLVLNLLYRYDVIDPTNKAYGLNYTNRSERPVYDRDHLLALCTTDKLRRDEAGMIQILENWKKKQKEEKPLMLIINTSGGGSRSAAFTMNVLQKLDAQMEGKLMDKTFLITGASGGMFGAAYFRALARLKVNDPTINLQDRQYTDNISEDLLNPLFSSFVARDLASPAQKFKVGKYEYIKDRGYAFEQKLNINTRGVLDRQLRDIAPDEKAARIPLMLLSSVITRDSRTMLISSQPVSFLMRPVYDSTRIMGIDPDAVDFSSFFYKQDPMNIRLLTALRMNATFPYVLPNVWLPTNPVIDVMDAGFRDNFGEEVSIRFLNVFREWILKNTRGVLMIQIRDRKVGGWESPFESTSITEIITKPVLLLQYNWYKMQEYNQDNLLSVFQGLMGPDFYKMTFQYEPKKANEGVALNFHLTRQEKLDVANALDLPVNQEIFQKVDSLVNP
ncbi:MAG: patatin-like phospholipase family protein [Bacteroidota bacterium]|nr:patatin-like phospholipase family protein [Bacteroidota bacterium]MDP4212574.1 patatin-like phospholipase family protein [Bacteroidota bacterium]MDP4249882.1 patatin-like phospholipase family protein [Bacteroidota bacterium]